MSIENKVQTGINLALFAGAAFGAYKIYEFYKSIQTNPADHPTAAATLNYWIPGSIKGQIPDTTNSVGSNLLVGGPVLAAAGVLANNQAAAGQATLTADAGPHTAYHYDQALSKYAIDHGFPNGATAAASDGWPYTPDPNTPSDLGFADWASQGFPDLSTII